jgi:hypothetical protein
MEKIGKCQIGNWVHFLKKRFLVVKFVVAEPFGINEIPLPLSK